LPEKPLSLAGTSKLLTERSQGSMISGMIS
jgi:hypothetical protein